MEMKIIKPYMYPKKIYIREEIDLTQQLVQQANSDTMYETSHQNLYGTPQYKEPPLPQKLNDHDITFDLETPKFDFQHARQPSKKSSLNRLNTTFNTSNSRVRTMIPKPPDETYEERKARIYSLRDFDRYSEQIGSGYIINQNDSINQVTVKSVSAINSSKPRLMSQQRTTRQTQRMESFNQNSPIKVENQITNNNFNNQSFSQNQLEKETFNKTYSTINNVKLIENSESPPGYHCKQRMRIVKTNTYQLDSQQNIKTLQSNSVINNKQAQQIQNRPYTSSIIRFYPQSCQVTPLKTRQPSPSTGINTANTSFNSNNKQLFQHRQNKGVTQRQSQLKLINQIENSSTTTQEKRHHSRVKSEIQKLKDQVIQRGKIFNFRQPVEWELKEKRKELEKDFSKNRLEEEESQQKILISQIRKERLAKFQSLMERVKEERIKCYKNKEFKKYFGHLHHQQNNKTHNLLEESGHTHTYKLNEKSHAGEGKGYLKAYNNQFISDEDSFENSKYFDTQSSHRQNDAFSTSFKKSNFS